jgi:hypothetical protein
VLPVPRSVEGGRGAGEGGRGRRGGAGDGRCGHGVGRLEVGDRADGWAPSVREREKERGGERALVGRRGPKAVRAAAGRREGKSWAAGRDGPVGKG